MESMIPRSRKESVSAKPSPGWPKRKLSTTNCRSCSMFGMRSLLSGVSDELVDHELRGEDADERHVVLDSDRASLPELPHQLLHGEGVEDAVLLDAPRRQQRVHVVAPRAA